MSQKTNLLRSKPKKKFTGRWILATGFALRLPIKEGQRLALKTSVEGSSLRAEARYPGLDQLETIEMHPVVHSQPLELDMNEAYWDIYFASTVLGEFLGS